mgnify:CR=1 FL=1
MKHTIITKNTGKNANSWAKPRRKFIIKVIPSQQCHSDKRSTLHLLSISAYEYLYTIGLGSYEPKTQYMAF